MTLRIKGATTIKGLTSVNWSPNLLFAAGEQGVWYDPSDFSTMFQDTAGTTPVTATGQSVARINDKSGNGNNATQPNATFRPTLQIDGNGKYYLSFDGVDDNLNTPSINFSATNKMTSFAGVRKNSDPPVASVIAELLGTLNNRYTIGGYVTGSPATQFFVTSGGAGLASGPATSASYAAPITVIHTGVGDIANNICLLRLNGTQVASDTTVQGPGTYPNVSLYIGSRAGTFYLNGRIYGLIIRGAASTASQIAMTETYMNSKTAAY